MRMQQTDGAVIEGHLDELPEARALTLERRHEDAVDGDQAGAEIDHGDAHAHRPGIG